MLPGRRSRTFCFFREVDREEQKQKEGKTMFQKWLQRFLGVAVGVGAVLVCGALPALAEEAPTMESLAAAVAEKGIVLDNSGPPARPSPLFSMPAGFAMVETG